jgi:hypothetical protein
MAFECEAIRAIFDHFVTKQQLVADILVGPRREGWFNAESFVALSAISSTETFTVYGEQCYANIPRCLAGKGPPSSIHQFTSGLVWARSRSRGLSPFYLFNRWTRKCG